MGYRNHTFCLFGLRTDVGTPVKASSVIQCYYREKLRLWPFVRQTCDTRQQINSLFSALLQRVDAIGSSITDLSHSPS